MVAVAVSPVRFHLHHVFRNKNTVVTDFGRFDVVLNPFSSPQRGGMSIEKGILPSCTPAECYVDKQVATCVKINWYKSKRSINLIVFNYTHKKEICQVKN